MRRLLLAALVVLVAITTAGAQPPTFQQATGTITTAGSDCSVATRCVVLPFAERTANGTIELAGTFTGTAQFEASLDNTNWFSLNVQPNGSTSFVTSATQAGQWIVPMATKGVRVRASALSNGSITVRIILTSASRGGVGGGSAGAGVSAGAGNDVQLGDGAGGFRVDTGNFKLDPADHNLHVSGCYTISTDVFLCRTAANAAAFINGTTAQTLHVYGTTTGPRRLTFAHSGTRASISSGTDPIDLTATTLVASADKGVDLGDATHRYKNSYTTQPVVPIFDAGNSGASPAIDWTNCPTPSRAAPTTCISSRTAPARTPPRGPAP
jgi:hypothetical protein